MPKDLQVESDFRDYTVADRYGNELPSFKGILATSILATDAETPKACDLTTDVLREVLRRPWPPGLRFSGFRRRSDLPAGMRGVC